MRFIRVAVFISISFIFEYHSVVWIYHLFHHLPVDGHLGWFQHGTIMNKAAVNIHHSCLGGHGFCFLIQSVFVFNNKTIWSIFLFTTLHWLHLYFQSKCNNEVNLNSFQSSHFCFLFVLLFLFCFLLSPLSELSEFCFVFMLPRFFSCWCDSCARCSLSTFTLEMSVFCLN